MRDGIFQIFLGKFLLACVCIYVCVCVCVRARNKSASSSCLDAVGICWLGIQEFSGWKVATFAWSRHPNNVQCKQTRLASVQTALDDLYPSGRFLGVPLLSEDEETCLALALSYTHTKSPGAQVWEPAEVPVNSVWLPSRTFNTSARTLQAEGAAALIPWPQTTKVWGQKLTNITQEQVCGRER